MNSAVPVLKKILVWGGILAVVVVVGGSIAGYLAAGWTGVTSALIGTAMAVVFLAITALSILIASRFGIGGFFGIVMGAWLLKFVLLGPLMHLYNRPTVEGVENIPTDGPAIMAGNHLSIADWLFAPLMSPRRRQSSRS